MLHQLWWGTKPRFVPQVVDPIFFPAALRAACICCTASACAACAPRSCCRGEMIESRFRPGHGWPWPHRCPSPTDSCGAILLTLRPRLHWPFKREGLQHHGHKQFESNHNEPNPELRLNKVRPSRQGGLLQQLRWQFRPLRLCQPHLPHGTPRRPGWVWQPP